jgi:hypothetical protein
MLTRANTGMGIAWKLSATDGTAPVQFEWTWVPEQSRAYWDLSMIDAHAKRDGKGADFVAHGMTVQPMRGDQPVTEGNCVPVACAAGEGVCTAAYNFPEDWTRQRDCGQGVDLVLTLCG